MLIFDTSALSNADGQKGGSVILTIPLSRNQIRFSMSIANNLFQDLKCPIARC